MTYTIEGLKKLERIKIANRPKGWEEEVEKYLQHKWNWMNIQKERYEIAKKGFKDAKKMAKRLGVKANYG